MRDTICRRDVVSFRQDSDRQRSGRLVPNLVTLANLPELYATQMARSGRSEPQRPISMRNGNSARASSSLTDEQKRDEMRKLQDLVRDFVKAIVHGVILDIVLEDGTAHGCQCQMDAKLSVLSVELHGRVSRVRLAEIKEIRSGPEIKDVVTSMPVDNLCVTLLMKDNRCVSLRFGDESTREYFATSMKVLCMAVE